MKYDQKSSHKLPAQVTYFPLSLMISYAHTIATRIFLNKIMKKLSFFWITEIKTQKKVLEHEGLLIHINKHL